LLFLLQGSRRNRLSFLSLIGFQTMDQHAQCISPSLNPWRFLLQIRVALAVRIESAIS
jgi:hypothetical protein